MTLRVAGFKRIADLGIGGAGVGTLRLVAPLGTGSGVGEGVGFGVVGETDSVAIGLSTTTPESLVP
jgi:hypothetical protein